MNAEELTRHILRMYEPHELEQAITEAIRNTYRRGVIDGMTRYAWWKGGTQYVGTTGRTLEDAIARFKQEESE